MDFTEAWGDTCSNIGHATRIGNVTLLLKLLEEKKSVDAADNRGWYPVHEAAATSPSIECLEILLKQEGTYVNWTTHEGETALLLACKRRNGLVANKYVDLLLQYKANPNIPDNEEDTPLLEALRSQNAYVVEQLLQAGADVNAADCSRWSPLHEAANKKDPTLLNIILKWNPQMEVQDECGMTPIFTAAQYGCQECLEALLMVAKQKNLLNIVNIGAEDYATPLMIAAQQGFETCVASLLENGADPDLKTQDNATALHLAVQSDNFPCLSLLLPKMDLQPLINLFHPSFYTYMDDDMICPLHLAVEWESYACLKSLLEAGFSPDSLCCCNNLPTDTVMVFLPKVETSLSYAAYKSDTTAMSVLLEAGANVNPVNETAFNPLIRAMIAMEKNSFSMLLNNGANINCGRGNKIFNEVFLVSIFTDISFLKTLLYYGCDPNICFSHDVQTLKFCFGFIRQRKKFVRLLKLIDRFLLYSKNAQDIICSLYLNTIPSEHSEDNAEETISDDWFHELHKPSSLKKTCFIGIRKHLYSLHGFKLPEAVNALGLPSQLLNFLSCTDLIEDK